jgi:hypothetical protein
MSLKKTIIPQRPFAGSENLHFACSSLNDNQSFISSHDNSKLRAASKRYLYMVPRAIAALLFLIFLPHGCSPPEAQQAPRPRAAAGSPQILAVYEAWFGHPRHIAIDYSSHDPMVIRKQIRHAQSLGISAFVVDWYGYREPFIDRSYALMQTIAGEEKFHVAMMYDETHDEDGATDETIEDFKLFNKTYLSLNAPGRQAYLAYNSRPVIFIFPTGKHTDWNRVRAEVNKWTSPPLLIDEYPPGPFVGALDGFYAWVQGWAADGSNWGQQYLNEFYSTMQSKYPDKLAVGGVWAGFDDSKASWGLNRHISQRGGETFADTCKLWRQYSPPDNPLPFLFVETWNDYEEGTAIEGGIPTVAATREKPLCSSP